MNRIQSKFVLDAMNNLEKLNSWEYDFIYNHLADKDDDYELSTNENKKLNEISQKINR